MTTLAQAQAAIRSRLEANYTATPLRWKNEDTPPPDTPVAFVHVEVIVERSYFAAFGGGRFANLQRTECRIEAHVLVPVGTGVNTGLTNAEAIAAVFRSYRDTDISCFAAQAFPESGHSQDGSYDHVATVIVDFHFDLTG